MLSTPRVPEVRDHVANGCVPIGTPGGLSIPICYKHYVPLALKQLVGKGIISLFALKLKLTKKLGMVYGINKVVGAIEKGKCATLLVSNGNLLGVMHAFIYGRHINLDDKHKWFLNCVFCTIIS